MDIQFKVCSCQPWYILSTIHFSNWCFCKPIFAHSFHEIFLENCGWYIELNKPLNLLFWQIATRSSSRATSWIKKLTPGILVTLGYVLKQQKHALIVNRNKSCGTLFVACCPRIKLADRCYPSWRFMLVASTRIRLKTLNHFPVAERSSRHFLCLASPI